MKYIFSVFLFLLLIVFSLNFWYWYQLQPVNPSAEKVSFVVSKSESGNSIVTRLHSAGMVRSVTASKIYLRLHNLGKHLLPGGYVLTSNLATPEVFAVIAAGPRDIWVTIPEGWRREQISERLKNSLTDFDAPGFLTISATAEGQLFPDTYLIPAQAATADVMRIFLKNFAKKTNLNPADPAVRSTLILASLVEREAKTDADRKLVAGILSKRLAENWPLQVDASVQYAANKADDWWKPITDTKYPSQYNTYIYTGLPPGPICNPGLASIQAAASPEASPYWFYLTGTDGVTYYAKTLAEHNLNISKYLK